MKLNRRESGRFPGRAWPVNQSVYDFFKKAPVEICNCSRSASFQLAQTGQMAYVFEEPGTLPLTLGVRGPCGVAR